MAAAWSGAALSRIPVIENATRRLGSGNRTIP